MKIIKDKEERSRYLEKAADSHILSPSFFPDMQLVLYERNEKIYHQEEELDYIYILIHGKVKVSCSSSNGKETIFRILDKPRIMGEMELISGSGAFTDVEAVETTHCFLLPVNTCRNSLFQDIEFLRYCCFNMAEALSLANNQSSINQNFSPKSRVVSYILSVQSKDTFSFDYKIVSNITGISERHVFRIISSLLQDGLIEKKQKKFCILDLEQLQQLAGDFYIIGALSYDDSGVKRYPST